MFSILSSPTCMHVAKALCRKIVEANRGGSKIYGSNSTCALSNREELIPLQVTVGANVA